MAKHSKDTGLSLLQKSAAAAAGFALQRGRSTPHAPIPNTVDLNARNSRRANSAVKPPNWPLRIILAVALVAGELLLIGNKDRILTNFGYESVPSLPMPAANLSADEQALYWTYALYDLRKFRIRFHIEGYYAISRAHARRELERLLPQVAPATLGEISAYSTVAFRSVSLRTDHSPVVKAAR